MAEIDSISWRKLEKFLLSCGCEFVRERGDHRVYSKSGLARPLIVPQYKRIPAFITLNNLRVLGISKKEFLKKVKNM
jgi:predicted RNA binding protein YcfA (HicA-like mRNA interferase family)